MWLFLHIKKPMTTFLTVLVVAVLMVGLAFAGLAIKLLVKKNGEFKRHCTSTDPYTGKQHGCVCSALAQANCNNKTKFSPLEVNKELLSECGTRDVVSS